MKVENSTSKTPANSRVFKNLDWCKKILTNIHCIQSKKDNKKTIQWHQPQMTWMHLQKQFIKTSEIVLFLFIKALHLFWCCEVLEIWITKTTHYSAANNYLTTTYFYLFVVKEIFACKQKLKSETPILIWQQFEVVGCKSLVFDALVHFPLEKVNHQHTEDVYQTAFILLSVQTPILWEWQSLFLVCNGGWHANINLMLQYL